MEEKKQRGILFSKGIRILTIVIFILAVGIFTGASVFLTGLFKSGLQPEDMFQNGVLSYEETYQCGNEIGEFMHHLANAREQGETFAADGKVEMDTTIDITDWSARGKEQNKYTTYTVENLKKMQEQGTINELENVLYNVESGYFEEEFYSSETEFAAEKSSELTKDFSEYSLQFQYLYRNRENNEGLKPESGKYLAEYAGNNPDTVSLMELYRNLIDTADQVEYYFDELSMLESDTNIMYVVENTDTKAVYTNVPGWKSGYNPEVVKGMDKSLFFQAERKNGSFTDIFPSELSNAEEDIKNWFKNNYLVGENEKITILLNTEYPVDDMLARNSTFYSKYAKWGRVLMIWTIASFLTGLLALILITAQAGRVREDRELHLKGIDRIPTEVVLATGMIPLALMLTLGVFYLDTGSAGEVLAGALIVAGQMMMGSVFLCTYLSLVRRIKGHLLWKSSLCHTIAKSCKNVYMARKTSGRMIIAFIVLVLGNLFSIILFQELGFLMALIGDGVVLLYLLRESAGRQVIKDGLGRIASGELDFKINAKELIGDNQEMAEAVNHVGDGLQNAVKETLKSERLKADLITNVSHDIKTPLTSIINYVDLLKREDIQDPKIKGYIDILDSKSQRLKQLTEDLVEASKISSGNVVLDMQPIHFGELVWQTNGEFEEKFQARGLELVCKIPETPTMIMADGRRMWRVVENLYNNVAKYAMANTRVYVEVKKIGCRVIFEVKNISERPLNFKAEELTERFVRGDVSRNTEGSGLGLSIAQNLVKLQNGTFDIYLDGDLFKVTITFEGVQDSEAR
ncbi:MAG: HAMP domain-containing histidine kinase [Clostridiales bacterium]|nr:HAMP domain-containing histidine kinase [Clostridiales bacterium]